MKPGTDFEAFAAKGIRTATAPRRVGSRLAFAAGLVGLALAAVGGGELALARFLLLDSHVRGAGPVAAEQSGGRGLR
jgi:hypothetical protein